MVHRYHTVIRSTKLVCGLESILTSFFILMSLVDRCRGDGAAQYRF